MAGGVGPSSPLVASGEGPLLLFVSGGVGPRSLLVHGGVGASSPFMPGAVGPSSSFGLGPSFVMHGAGGSSSCVFHGWRCWGLVVLFVGGGGVPLSRCFWVVVVVVRPHGFLCTVWSCHRSRVRVVGGHSCLQALHLLSSSLASSCIISVCCRCVLSSPCHCLVPSLLSHVAVVAMPSL